MAAYCRSVFSYRQTVGKAVSLSIAAVQPTSEQYTFLFFIRIFVEGAQGIRKIEGFELGLQASKRPCQKCHFESKGDNFSEGTSGTIIKWARSFENKGDTTCLAGCRTIIACTRYQQQIKREAEAADTTSASLLCYAVFCACSLIEYCNPIFPLPNTGPGYAFGRGAFTTGNGGVTKQN